MSDKIMIRQGDITTAIVDAIVNAANTSLLGGGGVDGAIHRAAGPGLLAECTRLFEASAPLPPCPVGHAVITDGYDLPARYVIHTVGPVWHGGIRDEETRLRACYRSVFEIVARRDDILGVVFPSISTGAYGYPIELASRIALEEMLAAKEQMPGLGISVYTFTDEDYRTYRQAMSEFKEAGRV